MMVTAGPRRSAHGWQPSGAPTPGTPSNPSVPTGFLLAVYAGARSAEMESFVNTPRATRLDEAAARKLAFDLWPTTGVSREPSRVLPTPAHFEQACEASFMRSFVAARSRAERWGTSTRAPS